jgi:hypothetical protein
VRSFFIFFASCVVNYQGTADEAQKVKSYATCWISAHVSLAREDECGELARYTQHCRRALNLSLCVGAHFLFECENKYLTAVGT